ncbi:TonB-dependent receptor [Chitinophaga parva]|uniref:TonB-dependent receptor n=2 Tax=Chitinophaga parva TaxID=2169414 RepID=A0A2T7BGC2_9BACT|nr:TonB-dependent receptor [Chitinophaga parva]
MKFLHSAGRPPIAIIQGKATKKTGLRAGAFMCLLFGLFVVPAQAQRKTGKLKGIVTSEAGKYLPGINVDVRNGNGHVVVSTASDSLGIFEVNNLYQDSLYTLDFTALGYKPNEMRNVLIKAGGSSVLVQMIARDTATGLNAVVVVGYGKQRKITLTGAQSTVNAEELKYPVANLSTMLAGRVSGLVGVQRSGLPGSNAADIWIRGISTFGTGNDSHPLIIVDGVKGRSLDDLVAEDIASFTILKDASATAVYGAEGANGVIIITTKRGKPGKRTLMANYMEGVTSFTKLPKMADASTYMKLRNEAMAASSLQPAYSQDYIDSTLAPGADHNVYPNVDWMKSILNKIAHNRTLNISATGGSENTQYYTSVSYYEESSLLKSDGLQNYDAATKYKRYNFVSNVDMNWTKTTTFHLGLNGFVAEFNQPGSGATSAFTDAMRANPVMYPKMYPGNLVSGIAEGTTPSPNPYADITQSGYQNSFESRISSTVGLDQDLGFITKGLSVNGLFAFDVDNTNTQKRLQSRSIYYLNQGIPYKDDGSLNLQQVLLRSDALVYSQANDQSRNFSLQGQLGYVRSFGLHNVSGTIVYNQRSIPDPTATTYTDAIPVRTQNYAGRVTYSYDDRYLAEFDGGFTGSQVFSPENRYGFFPSFSGGWVLSREAFFQPLTQVLNFFKVRYSNGYSGAIGGTRFDYLTTITTGANGITFGTPSNNSGSSYTSAINISHYGANVRWAKSHDQDVGLELKTLNNKLSLTVDWFSKYRTGVFLTRANFPGFAGLQYNPDGNYGVTINKGIDGTLELAPMEIARKLNFSMRATFSYNKDKLLENGAAPYEAPYLDPRGQNINASQGYIAEGIFQSKAAIDNHADQSGIGGTPRIGDLQYRDLNGDGVVNAYDQTTINTGDVPRITVGMGFNFNYSNFYLSAFFQALQGARRMLSGIARSPFAGGVDNNLLANAEDRWTEDNHATHPFYPRLGYGASPNANNNVNSTWWVKDISVVRFKTLDMGYNLPKGKVFKKLGVQDARFYFTAINLFYWSPFKLWDPELNTGTGDSYPNTRNFSIGFQAHF